MKKLEILQLVKDLTQQQSDDVTLSGFYDTLIDDLGRRGIDILTDLEIIPVVSGQEEYSLPADAITERAIFLGGKEIRLTRVQQLEARDYLWRTRTGTPWAYSKDESTARVFRLYPIPDFNSTPIDWTYGEPFGIGFPPDALTIFFASRADGDVSNPLVLPITFQLLSWEFARPSKHQSLPFSDLCGQIAKMGFGMNGINWEPGQSPQGGSK